MWTFITSVVASRPWAVIIFGRASGAQAAAETVAMIGTGNVGAALGRRFAENGHKIFYGSRDPSAADVRELVAATGNGAVALHPGGSRRASRHRHPRVPWSAAEDVVRGFRALCAAKSSSTPRIRASWRATASPTIRSRTRTPSASRASHRARTSSRRSARSAPRRCSTPASPAAPSRCRSSATTARRRNASRCWHARSGSRPSTSARCATRASSRACITCARMRYGGRINFHLPRDPARD